MKVAKKTAQAIASIAVLSLLLSGSVFAYSTRPTHISNLAGPLDANPSSTTTTATEHASSTQTTTEHASSTTTQTTVEQHGGDANASSTTTQTTTELHGGDANRSSTTMTTTTEHSENQVTESTRTNESGAEHTLEFKLVPAAESSATAQGDAEVQIRGTDVRVDLQIEHAQNTTAYSVTLATTTAPSCTGSIGTLMTSDEGRAEAQLLTTLPTGTVTLGLLVCQDGKPFLTSDPANQTTTISQASTSESETQETHEVNAKQADKQDASDIKNAEDSKQIPAVVHVSGSGAELTQIDSKFSVSVSRPSDNSLSISISGTNVTGPRVLLINVTKDAGALSSLNSVSLTLDGNQVSEASSLSQVLSGTSTSPPSYIVLVTSSGVQLLVFIPHFSAHLIELLAPSAASGAILAQAPLLLAGFTAVAAVSAVLYMRRKRFLAAPASP